MNTQDNMQINATSVTLYGDAAIEYFKECIDKRVESLQHIINNQIDNLYLTVYHDARYNHQLNEINKLLQDIQNRVDRVRLACNQLFLFYTSKYSRRKQSQTDQAECESMCQTDQRFID